MKQLFAALTLVLGAQAVHAQTIPDTRSQYTQLVDSLISPLDKSRIPSGILYDRVPSSALLHAFNQYTSSNASHFFQSYFELRESAYSLAAFPIEHGELRPLAEAEATGATKMGGLLPVGILDYQFAVLDTLAEEKGSIRAVNGLYYDGYGSPYQTNRVTVVSPLADSVAQQVQFTFPSSYHFRNTSRTLSFGLLQIGPNQFHISPGVTVQYTFPSTGVQTLTFTLYFTDGSTSISRASVYVRPTLATRPAAAVTMPITPNIIGQTWRDYNGSTTYGEGEALSYLFNPQSKNDGKLRNPIIVMDGFDPSDKRNIDKIYKDFAPLVPALEAKGQERDLVILNFPKTRRRVDMPRQTVYKDVDGGADFIERNALVLVELMNRIKPLMADPNQKIFIIGPSMGGLISRYALALMEKNYADANNSATYQNPYWKHQVDTWFSFDAPHQGANIPLGDQSFLSYFSGMSEAAENNAARLNSTAAKQMLVYHNLDMSGQNYHIPFMRNLQNNGLPGSFGYPVQVRRVALANGSNNGQQNSASGSPGATGLQLDVARKEGNKKRQFFYRSTTPGTQIAANMYFSGNPGVRTVVFNGEARVIVAAVKPIAKRKETVLTSNLGSYDLAPGSTFDSQFQIQDGTLKGKQLPGIEFRFSSLRPNHTFIPTVSALGYQYKTLANYNGREQLPNPYTNLSQRSLTCNDETPFDEYYTYTSSNSQHVTLDAAAQQFVVRELFKVSQPPVFAANNPATVCVNGVVDIGLRDCSVRGVGTTYNWNISGPAVFQNTGMNYMFSAGPRQSIRSTGQAGTITVTVTASRTGAAASPPVTYSFEATTGGQGLDLYADLQGMVRVCPYTTVIARAQGMTSGPWTWTRRTVRADGTTTTPQTIVTQVPELPVSVRYDNIEVSVTAPGSCSGQMLPLSTMTVGPEYYDPYNRGGCDPYSFSVMPIPGDTYVDISTLTPESPMLATASLADEDNPHAWQAELYNDRGKKVKNGSTKSGKMRLETADLPSGLYHIKLKRGGQVITRNLSIQH